MVIPFARLGGKLKEFQFPPTTERQFDPKVVHTRYQNLHAQYWAVNITFVFALKKALFPITGTLHLL